MPVYNVSYDLRAPGQRYAALIDEITSAPTQDWAKPLESCFLVRTRETPEALFERLRAKVDANDAILVIQVCDNYQAWTSGDVHEWIRKNVPPCR